MPASRAITRPNGSKSTFSASPQGAGRDPADLQRGLDERLRRALRDELAITPDVRFERHGTLERTTFKTKRIVEVEPAQTPTAR